MENKRRRERHKEGEEVVARVFEEGDDEEGNTRSLLSFIRCGDNGLVQQDWRRQQAAYCDCVEVCRVEGKSERGRC